jgi:hypothetical protein
MLFFAIAMFYYTAMNNPAMMKFNLICISLIALRLIYTLIMASKKPIIYHGGALLLAALCWAFQPGWGIFFSFLYLVAAILEKQAKAPLEIGVDETGLTFNSLHKKSVPWSELNNVLIKDGVITVDYKNNKLFQKNIDEEVSISLETEFNRFCSNNLMAHGSSLKANPIEP